MIVTIGTDPHKGSHTALALDGRDDVLGQLRVRSGPDQQARLAEWANAWPGRTWAVENRVSARLPALPAARRARRRQDLAPRPSVVWRAPPGRPGVHAPALRCLGKARKDRPGL